MGAIKITVPASAAAPNFNRNDHAPLTNKTNAMAQPTHRYNGFTRSQHAMPSTAPAASASQTLLRCAARISSQLPPSTNHVAGTSAEGCAAYIANNGETATRKPLAIAAREPDRVNPIPAISSNDRIRSTNHNTSCTEYGERSPVTL